MELPPDDLQKVRDILARLVPRTEVRAFGSRVAGHAKPWSDLDLVLMGDAPTSTETMAALRQAFDESDLTIRVDVADWARMPEGLRDAVRGACEVVQAAVGGG